MSESNKNIFFLSISNKLSCRLEKLTTNELNNSPGIPVLIRKALKLYERILTHAEEGYVLAYVKIENHEIYIKPFDVKEEM